MRVKVEEQLENQCLSVPVQGEPEDEMALIKSEDMVLEPHPHDYLLKYLKLIGATQNIADKQNIIHDGKIFNPTPEVKKYKYNKDHCYNEKYIACGVNIQDNHWCRFFRREDPQQAIGFRYLNCDNSVYYYNPDHSEYYIDSRMEWFKPSPEGFHEKTES